MANPSYHNPNSIIGRLLYSGQIAATTPTTVYGPVRDGSSVEITHGAVCNTSAAAVTVSVSLLGAGDTADTTHRVVSGYSLAASDTLSLTGYLTGAMLGEGEAVSVTASTAGVIDVVLSGKVLA